MIPARGGSRRMPRKNIREMRTCCVPIRTSASSSRYAARTPRRSAPSRVRSSADVARPACRWHRRHCQDLPRRRMKGSGQGSGPAINSLGSSGASGAAGAAGPVLSWQQAPTSRSLTTVASVGEPGRIRASREFAARCYRPAVDGDAEPRELLGMPAIGFAGPGPLRDSLTASILAGTKTGSSSLLAD